MGILSNVTAGVAYKYASFVLAALLVVSASFGGWNWWRKNVYYDALHIVAAQKIEQTRKAEQKLASDMAAQAKELNQRSKTREEALEFQLAEAARSQSVRIEYRLRDRWLPVSCPAGASGSGEPVQVGGLRPEDEQFLVRFAFDADQNIDERNFAVEAYNRARQAVIEFNKK